MKEAPKYHPLSKINERVMRLPISRPFCPLEEKREAAMLIYCSMIKPNGSCFGILDAGISFVIGFRFRRLLRPNRLPNPDASIITTLTY